MLEGMNTCKQRHAKQESAKRQMQLICSVQFLPCPKQSRDLFNGMIFMGLSCNRATRNLNQVIKPFAYPLVYMVTPMVPFTKTIIRVTKIWKPWWLEMPKFCSASGPERRLQIAELFEPFGFQLLWSVNPNQKKKHGVFWWVYHIRGI